jgi:hypothetical protein
MTRNRFFTRRRAITYPIGIATAVVVRAATGHLWMSLLATVIVIEVVHVVLDKRSKRR